VIGRADDDAGAASESREATPKSARDGGSGLWAGVESEAQAMV